MVPILSLLLILGTSLIVTRVASVAARAYWAWPR